MQVTRASLAVTVAGCCALASGCDSVEGSGALSRESRAVEPFTEVEVLAGLAVELAVGDQLVEVEGDDNLVPHVATRVEAGVLRIEPLRDLQTRLPLRIRVRTPSLASASSLSGSSVEAAVSGVDALVLRVEAGSRLRASGEVARLTARLRAGGTLAARGVTARDVTVVGSGGGRLEVTATRSVDGSVQSGSEAWVFGQPSTRRVLTDGGGEVYFD